MNEPNNQGENYMGYMDKQYNYEGQKPIFGNHNQQQLNNVLKQSHSASTNGNSPMVKNTQQIQHSKSFHTSQQKIDLMNIKKQFSHKQYDQVISSIDRYLTIYDTKNPQYIEGQENSLISNFGNNNNNNQTQQQQQQNGYTNSNNSSSQNLESDDKMDIEDKNKEQENEIIFLIQTKSDCLLHLNRNEEFFRCQDEIYARDNTQTKVFINKGSIFFQLKRYKESLEEFQKYILVVKNDDNAYYLRGMVEEKLKLHQDALCSFNQALTLNPMQVKVAQKKTSILATLQRYEEAIENQKKVIQYFEINRNKQNSKQMYQQYFMMGKLYFHMNRLQDSYTYLEKAIQERSDHSETYYYLGEYFRCTNQLENAIECYEKAALYDSNNSLAMQRREEVQKQLIQESPNKANQYQQTSSNNIIEEEAQIITLDDIKKDIEKMEYDKRHQIQQIKEGKMIDSDVFELESTRTLVQQYSLNLAAYKSFLRVQDQLERQSNYSNMHMSSIHNFRNHNQQSMNKEEDSEYNSQQQMRSSFKQQRNLFSSQFIFRAPNPPTPNAHKQENQ